MAKCEYHYCPNCDRSFRDEETCMDNAAEGMEMAAELIRKYKATQKADNAEIAKLRGERQELRNVIAELIAPVESIEEWNLWPSCAHPGCRNKACLSERSDLCHPHTMQKRLEAALQATTVDQFGKWISVEDHLPPEDVYVLVLHKGGWVPFMEVMALRRWMIDCGTVEEIVTGRAVEKRVLSWYPGGLPLCNSTHWMPLPGLPGALLPPTE